MARERPSKGFSSRPLIITQIRPGTRWWRLHGRQYADPLGFGYGPSRFSDPMTSLVPPARFGIAYFGSTVKVCFAEAVLRDRGTGRVNALPIEWVEFESWTCAKLRVGKRLNLVDLRGDGLIRMGIPSDVARAQSQKLARIWSRALWQHETRPDGIIYPSRLNGETNIAVFDRALAKLHPVESKVLVDYPSELARIITDFDLAIA